MNVSLWMSVLFFWIFAYSKIEKVIPMTIIHRNTKKEIMLKSWFHLIKESMDLIKKMYNITDTDLDEKDLIIWSSGKIMNKKLFKSQAFREDSNYIYLFLSTKITEQHCLTRENIYNQVIGKIQKYKNIVTKYFQGVDNNENPEWGSMKELLALLIKSKELRSLLTDIKREDRIESARQKILQLVQENKNYVIFFDILKRNRIIYNILANANHWKTFVNSNFYNIKELINLYYPNQDESYL
ncbi:conserved Plasmodium protein, unknown function [Plasmodium berghei]|uniref:Uncharacterized protein n=2 Tax=Plasmodium berghei TaxID=5821 RepID=A0A509ALZ4_PLABA|nr:conserved Plasmodium protein, unknown function [Plasmodium berghei ANKA]CXI17734.1 conserved Plasmodium protein, unknown function [Plasmodium berghei]SCM19720.1 conserved Plasmodium protein, unknown function [Plasmodium berghei]SCN23460.1 conserved Plasmodium protein, unknown function [Plasmodium berghei]SCO59094.1 conserved Plasmodium protein, unknown function [Plasmodium berghei]SCO59757.1 conserved Plasmodium protein, unknown function [Plasmodium berghei]|eukprot:XP_034420607.1 conserved Plasmodium protein, unknown function [Plasmodium berghei ANKA]